MSAESKTYWMNVSIYTGSVDPKNQTSLIEWGEMKYEDASKKFEELRILLNGDNTFGYPPTVVPEKFVIKNPEKIGFKIFKSVYFILNYVAVSDKHKL